MDTTTSSGPKKSRANKSTATGSVAKFIAAAKDLLGEGYVVSEKAKVKELARDPSVKTVVPAAYIYPGSVEDLRGLLKIANDFKVPLWTYSTGKNWGYHTSSTSQNSAVVLLTRMNQILHVDSELAYAEIEPGVTYQQLANFLDEKGFDLWTDSPGGPPLGSVIGNALDRGVGVTRYSDHAASLCGLEVMLADGTLIRTGSNAEELKGASALFKNAVGPGWDSMFCQSNFGIVTKANIWLMRKPQDYSLVSTSINGSSSFASVLDQTRELMLRGVVPGPVRFTNDTALCTIVTQAHFEDMEGDKVLTAGDLAKLKTKYRIPDWQGSTVIYGDSSIVRTKSSTARRAWGAICRARTYSKFFCKCLSEFSRTIVSSKNARVARIADFVVGKVLGVSLGLLRSFPEIVKLHEGSPVEAVVKRAYFRFSKKRPDNNVNVAADGIGVNWYVPILPLKGEEIIDFIELCRPLFTKFRIDFYVTVITFTPRSACVLQALIFNREDPDDCLRAEQLYAALLELAHERGYQIFRSGPPGWPHLWDLCPELGALNKRVKSAIDPNNILAPGRYGI